MHSSRCCSYCSAVLTRFATVLIIIISVQNCVWLWLLQHFHSGNAKKAKRAMFVCLSGAFTWLVPVEVLTLSLKDYIPMIFTSDETILQSINVHFYIMAVTIFGDAVHSCLSGAIIGSGWQHVGAAMTVSCCWIVGIPRQCQWPLQCD